MHEIVIAMLLERIEIALGQIQCNQSLLALNTLKMAQIEAEKLVNGKK
jgi:hypothetical protein